MAIRIFGIAVVALALTSCGELESPTAPVPSISCSNPAPYFTYERAVTDQYVVTLNEGVSIREEAERLARVHHFKLLAVFESVLGGFGAEMGLRSLDSVRCESSVKAIHQNVHINRP